MHFLGYINNLIKGIQPQYIWVLLAWGIFIAGGVIFIKYKKPQWSAIGYCVLFVLLMRCALLGNPFVWEWYHTQLSVDDVGSRQQSVIYIEYYKFFKYPNKKFLAVGSSQTYTLYQAYSKKHNDITVFNLAGMTPFDFYLYRKYIKDRGADFILLYLSEFDMAKEPRLEGAKIAPSAGWELMRDFSMYWEIANVAKTKVALTEIIVGEMFPEYKFSFIYKGLLQKFLRKKEDLKTVTSVERQEISQEELMKDIEGIVQQIDTKWVKFQKYFLKKFLDYCSRESLKIIIVEGQYNPLAYHPSNEFLHKQTRTMITDIIKEYPLVTYISQTETVPLSKDDFYDAVHFKKDSALRFSEDLIKKIVVRLEN